MAITTIKHALLFTIILVSMNGINSQLLTTIFAVRDITALLENITDTSTVTSMFLSNILNQSADTQTRIADTQSEIASTQSRMEGTLDQIANTLTQVVQLLQLQSQQLQDLTDAIGPTACPTSDSLTVTGPTNPPDMDIIPTNTPDMDIPTNPPDMDIPRDCSDLASRGQYPSGSYTIQPWEGFGNLLVYCDMETDTGGWTVFQKRFDGSVDFYLGWDDYEDGFGSTDGEYWLGLRQIYQLTQQGLWMLRIDLADFQNNTAYAEYGSFSIGDTESNYTLSVGAYSGDAGDSLTVHNNQAFSTKDNDNDSWSANCAESHKGAWWYNACVYSNLNGLYLGESQDSIVGMVWVHWKGTEVLKRSEMKIRRIR